MNTQTTLLIAVVFVSSLAACVVLALHNMLAPGSILTLASMGVTGSFALADPNTLRKLSVSNSPQGSKIEETNKT